MQTTIRRWGNSAGAVLPAKLLKSIGISIDDTVDIEVVDNTIILRSGVEHKSVQDLLKASPAHAFELSGEDSQWLNAAPVGNEVVE